MINLVNQAFLTVTHPITFYESYDFSPCFLKSECENENKSSTERRGKLYLLARLLWEMVALLPIMQTQRIIIKPASIRYWMRAG